MHDQNRSFWNQLPNNTNAPASGQPYWSRLDHYISCSRFGKNKHSKACSLPILRSLSVFPLERRGEKHFLLSTRFSLEMTSRQRRCETTLGKSRRKLSFQTGSLPVSKKETVLCETSVGCLGFVASWDPCCCIVFLRSLPFVFHDSRVCLAFCYGVEKRKLSPIFPIDAQVHGS